MQKSIYKWKRTITAMLIVFLLFHVPVSIAIAMEYEQACDFYYQTVYDADYDTDCPEEYDAEDASEDNMKQEGAIPPQIDPFFHDVPEHAWYHTYITEIAQLNIMHGISDQNFSPQSELTRAMFVTMLYRMYLQSDNDLGDKETVIAFHDVQEDAWYYDAIIWASTHGIATGFADHTFRPHQAIGREQLIVMLYRYHIASGQPVPLTIDPNIHYFRDYSDISPWARDAVRWGVYHWILRGNHTFRVLPDNTTTRAESAAIIYRFMYPDSLPAAPQMLSCPGPEYIPAPPAPIVPEPHPTRPFDTNRERISGRTWSQSDVDLLARCILAEARGRPGFYELVMVGRTVTNRVDANRNSGGAAYRGTISGVIQQPRQFVWIRSGSVPQRYRDAAEYSLYRWAYGYDAPVNRFVRSGSDHRYLYFVGQGHTVGNFFRNGRFSDFVF